MFRPLGRAVARPAPASAAATEPAARDHSLDGLRGLAALVVVFFHFACAYVPSLLPEQTPTPAAITDVPGSIIFNGSFAVAVFFVLSGYVVSASAAKRRYGLPVQLASRYLRLGVPVLFSTLFAWALLQSFPDALHRLKQIEPHPWLSWSYDGNLPGFGAALVHGIYGVFRDGSSSYNNALWTMKVELLGSIGIYLIYRLPRRWQMAGIAVFALIALRRMQYEGFVAGMLLREFSSGLSRRLGWAALLSGLLLGSQYKGFGERMGLPALPAALSLGDPMSVWYVLGGGALVYSVLVLPQLKSFFGSPPLRFLGKISFPLYLVHVPLLYTVFAAAYGRTPLWLLFAAFLATSILLGMIAERLIDAPTLQAIQAIQRASLKFRMQMRRPDRPEEVGRKVVVPTPSIETR